MERKNVINKFRLSNIQVTGALVEEGPSFDGPSFISRISTIFFVE